MGFLLNSCLLPARLGLGLAVGSGLDFVSRLVLLWFLVALWLAFAAEFGCVLD